MNLKKIYWVSLVILFLISIIPLVILILHLIKISTNILFFIYGVLTLLTTANLASYLTNSCKKKSTLGRVWVRLVYVVLNVFIIIFNIIQVLLIHLAF